MARTGNHHDPPGNGLDVKAVLTYLGKRKRCPLSIEVAGTVSRNLEIPARQALTLMVIAAAFPDDDGETCEDERGRLTAEEVAARYSSIWDPSHPVKVSTIREYVCSLERALRLELRGTSGFELPPLRLIDWRRKAGYRLSCRLTVNPPLPEIIP